jgi:poly(3-hydroxybutyrate) depolymerase
MARNLRLRPFAVAVATLGGVVACGGERAPPLAAIDLDAERVGVAGLSSGAAMATQVHVALNARIHGAALVAGVPYGCAQGLLETALGPCMSAQPQVPEAATLAKAVRQHAADGAIDPLAAFAGDRVLVLHGAKDGTVSPALAPVSAALYRELGGDTLSVTLDDQRSFAHGLPTLGGPAPCEAAASPWLLDCGIDGAGLAMRSLFGSDADGDAGATATGTLAPFDQTELVPEGASGLADTGFVYTPAACADGRCGALVLFHGCQQNVESVGEAFVRDAGFNRWADRYGVVVVYPQAQSSYVPLNPKACWDWWGYGGADYDLKSGGQVRFVAAILDRLGAAR